jgi:hypothetical protein
MLSRQTSSEVMSACFINRHYHNGEEGICIVDYWHQFRNSLAKVPTLQLDFS